MAAGLPSRKVAFLAAVLLLAVFCNAKINVDGSAEAAAVVPNGYGEEVDIIAAAAAQRQLLQTNDTTGQMLGLNGRPPAWYGRFDPIYKRTYIAPAVAVNTCKSEGRLCAAIEGHSYPYEEYILDPTSATLPAAPVLKVRYPKGSWSAGSPFPGGTLFYAYPFKYHPTQDKQNQLSRTAATLEYEVFVPHDFPYNKGGKLPGLSGGAENNGRGCGGGVNPDKCFSVRIMWRRGGMGEAYMYVPEGKQAPEFCTFFPECRNDKNPPCNVCNFAAGVSFGRGSFSFIKESWNKITMTVKLNTPGQLDGVLEVRHNDKVVIRYNRMNYRTLDDVFIEGVEFSTWFGGSDDTWAPKHDAYLMFRNFKAWRNDPPAMPGARAASLAAMSGTPGGQVTEEEEMFNIAG